MSNLSSYTYLGKTYEVVITRKRISRIYYRFRNDTFYVSAPKIVPDSKILKGLDKFAPSFINNQKPAPYGNDYIYVFGVKCNFNPNGGVFSFTSGELLKYKSLEDFEKKMRKILLNVITDRVRYYEARMALAGHNIRIRNMRSRYGSNAKNTRTVAFTLHLYHYSIDIIDSVVVHELSHSVVFDHSKAFYNVVFKYCPSYKSLHTKLRKGIYQ